MGRGIYIESLGATSRLIRKCGRTRRCQRSADWRPAREGRQAAPAASASGSTTDPAAPTGTSVTAGNNEATITWGAFAGATSYNIYRSTTQSEGNGRLYVSSDRGGHWTYVGLPFPLAGNSPGRAIGERLTVDPNKPSTLFYATRTAGLWKSVNSSTRASPGPRSPRCRPLSLQREPASGTRRRWPGNETLLGEGTRKNYPRCAHQNRHLRSCPTGGDLGGKGCPCDRL